MISKCQTNYIDSFGDGHSCNLVIVCRKKVNVKRE